MSARALFLAALALLASGCATVKTSPAPSPLRALIDREWRYQLQRGPTYASVLGDRRWNDRWDDLSLEAIEADHRHNQAVLAELDRLDAASLSTEERLDLQLLQHDYQGWVDGHRFGWHLLPTHHMGGIPEGIHQPPGVQSAYQLAEVLRFESLKDYQDWVRRLERFGTYVDQVIALMREGMKRGLVHPKVSVQRIPGQLAAQLVDAPEKSAFFAPFRSFPPGLPPAEQQALASAGARAVSEGVLPALARFRDFVAGEYLAAAPDPVGVWQFPDGADLYAHQVRRYTTTDLDPDQIHQLGLSEVKRLREAMEQVKQQVGFEGTLAAFFQHLRTSRDLYHPTGERLLEAYRSLAKRIDPTLVKLFRTLPRQPYGVEPTPELMAPHATTGFYYPGAADGSRPGIYQVNLFRPESRPRWEMVPLTLHEAVPGHHLQVALAAEQEGLSEFRRFGYHVAYGEGWGLYAETLGHELGLYSDPYDHFGQLTYEMWRAIRLVVDTGMHSRRWTRAQAIAYFLENSPRQELDVTNEVDRYIVTPGQALAYKIGQLKIRELRTRAEKALGERFDVRAFHDQVLLPGSVPLDILERRIGAWIEDSR